MNNTEILNRLEQIELAVKAIRDGLSDPVSPPSVVAGNAVSPTRAMAATMWGEARNEPALGKEAVAWVILNRSAQPGWWGRDVLSVCVAKWQFSCWWDQQAPRVRSVDESDAKFVECLEIAERVMNGRSTDPTAGADHYYADYIAAPKWAKGKLPTVKIGRHIFFRLGLKGDL